MTTSLTTSNELEAYLLSLSQKPSKHREKEKQKHGGEGWTHIMEGTLSSLMSLPSFLLDGCQRDFYLLVCLFCPGQCQDDATAVSASVRPESGHAARRVALLLLVRYLPIARALLLFPVTLFLLQVFFIYSIESMAQRVERKGRVPLSVLRRLQALTLGRGLSSPQPPLTAYQKMKWEEYQVDESHDCSPLFTAVQEMKKKLWNAITSSSFPPSSDTVLTVDVICTEMKDLIANARQALVVHSSDHIDVILDRLMRLLTVRNRLVSLDRQCSHLLDPFKILPQHRRLDIDSQDEFILLCKALAALQGRQEEAAFLLYRLQNILARDYQCASLVMSERMEIILELLDRVEDIQQIAGREWQDVLQKAKLLFTDLTSPSQVTDTVRSVVRDKGEQDDDLGKESEMEVHDRVLSPKAELSDTVLEEEQSESRPIVDDPSLSSSADTIFAAKTQPEDKRLDGPRRETMLPGEGRSVTALLLSELREHIVYQERIRRPAVVRHLNDTNQEEESDGPEAESLSRQQPQQQQEQLQREQVLSPPPLPGAVHGELLNRLHALASQQDIVLLGDDDSDDGVY
eukprot:scaffold4011_cov197-Ochromonas_danica.AAC.19